jgi:hypothetical protein
MTTKRHFFMDEAPFVRKKTAPRRHAFVLGKSGSWRMKRIFQIRSCCQDTVAWDKPRDEVWQGSHPRYGQARRYVVAACEGRRDLGRVVREP